MQFKPIVVEQFSDQKAQDYMEIKNQTLIQSFLEDPKIARSLDYADYLVSYHFQETVNKKAHNKELIEIFNSDYIISKLYGLELHRIKEYFTRFGNKIQTPGFVLILMKLLSFQMDEIAYLLNGLRDLAELIANEEGIITFDSFVAYYMACGDAEGLEEDDKAQYSIKESKFQDNYYHKHEIQKALFCESINKFSILEENQSEVLLLNTDFKIFKSLKLESEDVHYIILDYDYSDHHREFCCSLSTNMLLFFSFIDQLHSKKKEFCDYLLTKVHFLTLLNKWATITTNQQMILWSQKEHVQQKVLLQLQGGKIQSIVELVKNQFICLQTDLKRVHLFNPKFEQLIVIQDTLLIQTILFSEIGQCFYSSNYTNKIQKWLIEENGVDYTKDKVIEICKPESSVLAIGFVQELFITYDNSNQIRVFDTEDFKKIATFKKQLKPTNRMKIIQIAPLQFVIVGNRISSFQIEVKSDEIPISIQHEKKEQMLKDHQSKMKQTKIMIKMILKAQPSITKFRGTKHQDQIESMLVQIQGAKNQLLPKVKQKEKNQYIPLDEEFIKEKLESFDKAIYSNRLMKERMTQQQLEPEQEQFDFNKLSQNVKHKLNQFATALNKIDQKCISDNNSSKMPSLKQLQHTRNKQQKRELELSTQEQSLSHKKNLSILTNQQMLLTGQNEDYLNVFLNKKKLNQQSINYDTRYIYKTQRGKAKRDLFQTLYKTQYKKTSYTPQQQQQTQNEQFISTRNTIHKPTFRMIDSPPPEIPEECADHLRKTQMYFKEAMSALTFMQSRNSYLQS